MKKIKKLVLYTTTFIIISSGIKVNLNKNKNFNTLSFMSNYDYNFNDEDFKIAAHRGFSSLAIENTLESINIADSCNYIDYIETDVRLTKDKKLVISHNDTITTTKKRQLKISKTSYTNLKKYKYTNIFDKIKNISSDIQKNDSYELLTLEKCLNSCNNKKIILDLKFKNNTEDFLNELDNEIKGIDLDNLLFQSDNLQSLLVLKKKHPEYNILAIMKTKKDLEYFDIFDNISLYKNLVDKDLVDKLVNDNKNFAVWTLNNPNDINKLMNNLGDNYKQPIYITDYPNVVATCLYKKQEDNKKRLILNH